MIGATRFGLLMIAAALIGTLSAELIRRDKVRDGMLLALSAGSVVLLLARSDG